MDMRGQDERHFRVVIEHDRDYRFVSQAMEDGRLHGDPFVSDEPDPVGSASGPSTPALLASALGHCLSAALLEALRKARVEVEGFATEVDAVVHLGEARLPRIRKVHVTLRPKLAEVGGRAGRCAEIFEKHCTVTSSVKAGIDVHVDVDWQVTERGRAAQ